MQFIKRVAAFRGNHNKQPVTHLRVRDSSPRGVRYLDGSVLRGFTLHGFVIRLEERHRGKRSIICQAIARQAVCIKPFVCSGVKYAACNVDVKRCAGVAARERQAAELIAFISFNLNAVSILIRCGLCKRSNPAVVGGADHKLAAAAFHLFARIASGAAGAYVAVAARSFVAVRHAVVSYGGTCNGILHLGTLRKNGKRTCHIYRNTCIAVCKVCLCFAADDRDGCSARNAHVGSARAGNSLRHKFMRGADVACLDLEVKPVGQPIERCRRKYLAGFFYRVERIVLQRFLPVPFDEVHELVYVHNAFKHIARNELKFLLYLRREGHDARFRRCCGLIFQVEMPCNLRKHLIDHEINHPGFNAFGDNLSQLIQTLIDFGNDIGGKKLLKAGSGKKFPRNGADKVTDHRGKLFGNRL